METTKTLDNGLTFEVTELMRIIAKRRFAGRDFEATITFREDGEWRVESAKPPMAWAGYRTFDEAVERVKEHHQGWCETNKELFERQTEFDASWRRLFGQ